MTQRPIRIEVCFWDSLTLISLVQNKLNLNINNVVLLILLFDSFLYGLSSHLPPQGEQLRHRSTERLPGTKKKKHQKLLEDFNKLRLSFYSYPLKSF